ncbi:MAG: hypothetical protein CVU56_01340 [Deltaproteobacteria bacterium HGW-Deltaproteobacteria-14]|jgi:hypothetical protein|nr:MAG: hypothetical protein CVU56_01340 [Deltaproteobacteria bacterium HGW-Deltaproteobacteria-14]
MGGRFASRALSREVALTVEGAAPLAGRLVGVRIFAEEGASEWLVLVTLALSLETYERVQDEELFEVSLATTAPGAGQVILWNTAPVEVELRLLAPPPAASPDALADALASGLGAELGASVTAFRWWRTLQAQASPSGNVVKAGYRSRFAADYDAAR